MGSIKTTVSAVDVYASNCHNDYFAIINTANEILSRVEKLYVDVQDDYEKISKQIFRLKMLREEIATKVKSYEHTMEEAKSEAESWQAEINYLYSHPDIVTSTDEDGNETTEEVYDYAAISAAERKRDDAMEIYHLYREKYEAAYAVLVETENTQSRFETIKKAIHIIGESIQNDIYEIKKYINAISDEAEYNMRSLQGVLDGLRTYLASKAMFMPVGTIYEDFAPLGGSISVDKSSSAVVQDKNNYELGKKAISTIKTAIEVAATVVVSSGSSLSDIPQQKYISATPKTEIVRTIEYYQNNGTQKQEKLNKDYLKFEKGREKKEGELTKNLNVSAGAGGDMPRSEGNIKYIYNEDGIPIGIEIYPYDVSSKNVNGAAEKADGLRMTCHSADSIASKNKWYANEVVVEGVLTFSYNHIEQTAVINRKIHQYAPGIDLEYKRSDGKTNYEAMLKGKSPIILIQDSDGVKETRLDLHHITQQEVIGFPDSCFSQGALVELPVALHQKYTKSIHMRYPHKQGINRSFRVDKLPNHKYKLSKDETQFNEFRKQYWKARAQMLKEFSNTKN